MSSKVLRLAIFGLLCLNIASIGQAQTVSNLLKTRDSLHAQYEALQEGKKNLWGSLPKKSLQEQIGTLEAITATDSAIIQVLWEANERLNESAPALVVANHDYEQTNSLTGEFEYNRTAAALAHYTLLANKRELKLLQTETHYQEKLHFFQNMTAIITIILVVSIAFHFLHMRKYFGGV